MIDIVGMRILGDREKVNVLNQYEFWEEFTGLKDAKGTDIYEGDLLKQSDGLIKEVSFKSGHFGKGEDFDFHQIWSDDEVIGNIYENPDLFFASSTLA